MARRLTPGGLALGYASLATVWIAVSGLLVAIAIDDPAVRGIIEVGKGLLFVAVTSGLLYLLLRSWVAQPTSAIERVPKSAVGILPLGTLPMAIVLFGISLIVPVMSFAIAWHLAPNFEREAHANLSSIARFKAAQVQQWLTEHATSAQIGAGDAILAHWVAATGQDAGAGPAPAYLREHLRKVQWSGGFRGIQVLNSGGRPLLTVGNPEPSDEMDLSLAAQASEGGRVHWGDLRVGQDGAIVAHFVVGLYTEADAESVEVGYVAFTLSPESATLPMLGPWPIVTSTGRTLLVEPSMGLGVEVNAFDGEDGAQRVRVSAPFDPALPLASELREGARGTLGGRTHSGVDILAAHHPIPGTAWQVLVSMERTEIMRPLRETVLWVNIVAFVAAFLVIAILLLLWQSQNRSRLLAEQNRANALLDWHIGNSPLAAVEWDKDFRVSKWSPRAEAIFGWSAAEVIGRHPTEWGFVHPDDADSVRAIMRDLSDGTSPRNRSINRNLNKQGGVIDCEWYNSVRRAPDGRFESIFSLVQDITDRTRMERALCDSEAQFRTFIEGAPDGVFVLADDRFAFVNPAACRLFGAESPDELIGEPLWERFRADDRLAVQQWIGGLAERDRSRDLHEEVCLRMDGSEVPVEVSAQPMQFRGGDSVLVFARDISERKEVMRQRDFNARLLSMASRCAQLGGWEIDVQTDRVLWSDEVCQMLGEPRGTTVSVAGAISYFAPEWREHVSELLAAAVRDATPADEELEVVTRSGTRLWARVVGQPIIGERGDVVRIEGAVQDVTEQRAAEQRLRNSEAKLRAVTEASPDPIFMTDDEGKLLYCSPAVETTLGFAPESLIGRDFHKVLAPERYRAAIERGYAAFARTGSGPVVQTLKELEALHRDGYEVPIELSVSALQVDGRWHAVGVMRDITNRREFERNLSLQARRAEALLELPRVAERLDETGFMQWGQEIAEDLTGSRIAFVHFVHEDQQAIELVTWSRRTLEEHCRVPFQRHYPIAEAGVWADAVRERRHIVVNDNPSGPSQRGLPEGHPELRRLISVPVIENGKVTMLAGVGNKDEDYTDVDVDTVQLIAERIWSVVQRRRSETRLRQLSLAIEQSPNSVVITNLAAEIEYVNESFLQATGYTRAEVLGRNPRMLQSGKTPRQHFDAMWSALTQGRPWKGEFYNRRKDGTEYIEFGHVAPLRQPSGEITHYVAVKEDITEKKRIGRELDRHRHQLEELVEQRTAELVDARMQAESANRTKSAFLANMSHEIRTPMNGVLGMVELLWNTELTDEQSDMVATIRDSGQSLTRLIDDILDFSKIEAGQMELEHAPMNLRHVVESLCASLAPFASHRQVDLGCFVAPETPERVFGDEVRLRQMLYNLIGNGIKFSAGSPERRGRVCVRVEQHESEPTHYRFLVGDNGIGIAQKDQERLFQPFAQAEASTTRRFGGTGLGLTICRRLTDLMGGSISVSSALGEGALFTLELPFDVPPEQPAPTIPDLKGVHCILVQEHAARADVRGSSRHARDLARHLEVAGATAQVCADMGAARSVAAESAGAAVMIHLAERDHASEPPVPDSGAVPLIQIRWGVRNALNRGGSSTLDASTLTRDGLLKAAAVAVGRGDVVDRDGADSVRTRLPASTTVAGSSNAKILVVEDDAINRKVIEKQLAALGYQAELAMNGVDAVRKLRAYRYDLVLTDVHMPEMDGYALTRYIREQESREESEKQGFRRTPVIALTANALRGEAEKGLAIGMDAYLTKPIELKTLNDALSRYLSSDARSQHDATLPGAPESTDTSLPVFDLGVLNSLVGDDQDTVHALLREYVETLQRTWAEIATAASQGDEAAIAASAHKLKSSSRSVGALRIGELCQQIENAGRAGELPTIASLLHEVSTLRPVLEAAIQTVLDGNPV